MIRVGLHLSARLGISIGFTLVVVLALGSLVELVPNLAGIREPSLNTLGWIALNSIVNALRYAIGILPIFVLVGAILALLELQRRYELVVMKTTGLSIWRLTALPIAFTALFGVGVALVVDPLVLGAQEFVRVDLRPENAGGGGRSGWLVHPLPNGRAYIHADHVDANLPVLSGVTVYTYADSGLPTGQYAAQRARLDNDQWLLEEVTERQVGEEPRQFDSLALDGSATRAQARLALGSASTMGYFELSDLLASANLDPQTRSVAQMRLSGLQALPLVLVGSLLIAFAFTARYRRQGTTGTTILYGVLLGFVVFVVISLADQAGSAGILDPAIAAWGPAIVATVIGVTVLLNVEDG